MFYTRIAQPNVSCLTASRRFWPCQAMKKYNTTVGVMGVHGRQLNCKEEVSHLLLFISKSTRIPIIPTTVDAKKLPCTITKMFIRSATPSLCVFLKLHVSDDEKSAAVAQ